MEAPSYSRLSETDLPLASEVRGRLIGLNTYIVRSDAISGETVSEWSCLLVWKKNTYWSIKATMFGLLTSFEPPPKDSSKVYWDNLLPLEPEDTEIWSLS